MTLRTLAFLCLVLSSAGAWAQTLDTLAVPLASEATAGPFGEIVYGLQPTDEGEALTGVPDSLADLEHYAWSVRDTSGADAVVGFVIGRDDRQRHVVIADTDNDERLDDERALVLPHYRLAPMREWAGKTLPAVRVEVERGHGAERWTEAVGLVVNPYIDAPDGTPYERGGRPYYFGGARRHAWGRTPDGDTVYVAPVYGSAPLASDSGVQARISGMGRDEENYGVDDVVALGGRTWRIVGVTPDESAVRLVEAPEGVPDVGLRVGRIAPDFAARTEAGDSLRLSDLRGRHVLLDFWGTWCQPCRWQTPSLKEAAAAYPHRLLILGVADDEPEAVADYAAEEEVSWPQVVEGRERPRPVHTLYEVTSWPSTFLIDPEGRIVAKGLYVDMLDRLAQHLGPPPAE